MADLNDINSAQSVKIVGSDSTGLEQTPVNSTNNGALHSNLRDATGAEVLGIKPSASAIPFTQAENISYSAAVNNFAVAATPTDVFNIIGSGSKTIRIKKLKVSGSTTSGSAIKVGIQVIKRSTANTGGTRVTLNMVPHDSTSAAGTASVGYYTANPTTLGTSLGVVRTVHVGFTQSGLFGGEVEWDFDNQPFILRGAAEQLCVNFNATSITGSLISITVEWEEV